MLDREHRVLLTKPDDDGGWWVVGRHCGPEVRKEVRRGLLQLWPELEAECEQLMRGTLDPWWAPHATTLRISDVLPGSIVSRT